MLGAFGKALRNSCNVFRADVQVPLCAAQVLKQKGWTLTHVRHNDLCMWMLTCVSVDAYAHSRPSFGWHPEQACTVGVPHLFLSLFLHVRVNRCTEVMCWRANGGLVDICHVRCEKYFEKTKHEHIFVWHAKACIAHICYADKNLSDKTSNVFYLHLRLDCDDFVGSWYVRMREHKDAYANTRIHA
jgi:hypothetical protein